MPPPAPFNRVWEDDFPREQVPADTGQYGRVEDG